MNIRGIVQQPLHKASQRLLPPRWLYCMRQPLILTLDRAKGPGLVPKAGSLQGTGSFKVNEVVILFSFVQSRCCPGPVKW